MKKQFALLMSLALLFVGFTACSDDDDDESTIAGTYSGTASFKAAYSGLQTSSSYDKEDYTITIKSISTSGQTMTISGVTIPWDGLIGSYSSTAATALNTLMGTGFDITSIPYTVDDDETTYTLSSYDFTVEGLLYTVTGTLSSGTITVGSSSTTISLSLTNLEFPSLTETTYGSYLSGFYTNCTYSGTLQ